MSKLGAFISVELLMNISAGRTVYVRHLMDEYSLKYLVYTHGADFSEVYGADGGYSHVPTPKVTVADTVGAGDSFTAVFVTSILQGMNMADSHDKAVEVSAYVCTQSGAINPLP